MLEYLSALSVRVPSEWPNARLPSEWPNARLPSECANARLPSENSPRTQKTLIFNEKHFCEMCFKQMVLANSVICFTLYLYNIFQESEKHKNIPLRE